MNYNPNNVSAVIGGQTITDFSDTTEVAVSKGELIEVDLTFTLHNIGEVKGKVFLTKDQIRQLKEV